MYKRRLVAGNHTVSKIAYLLSGVFNASHIGIILKFTREAINETASWNDSRIEKYIKEMLDSYNQPPDDTTTL
jgi:hypothetical protein